MANYSENSFIQRNGLIDNTFLDINKLPKYLKVYTMRILL